MRSVGDRFAPLRGPNADQDLGLSGCADADAQSGIESAMSAIESRISNHLRPIAQ